MLTNAKRLMQKERISVESDGPNVVMNFGNVEVVLPYETALLVSQWIRMRAKEAKRFAGDEGRHWSVLGVLSDKEQTRG
jgi:hypothetical protein